MGKAMAPVQSEGFSAIATACVSLLLLSTAQRCTGQTSTNLDFSDLKFDFTQPGCLGQKSLSDYICLPYAVVRKYCCGVASFGSNIHVTPVCKYWYGSFASAANANINSLDSLRARPPVSPSRICGYNYKPLSPCASECLDYLTWVLTSQTGQNLLAQLCGSPTQCATRCGCSPYTGTPRNVLTMVPTAIAVTTTPAPIKISLPCRQSPTGDCSWYRQCIEGHYPCSGKTLDAAVGFGERYCNHLSTFSFAFSDTGKRWISAVKTCKQVKLYESVLSASLTSGLAPAVSCAKLEGVIMNSFRQDCFIQPDSSQSSLGLCTMKCRDILAIMAVTLGTIPRGKSYVDGSSYRTAIAVEGQILKDIGTCVKNFRHRLQDLTCVKQLFKRVIKIVLKNIPLPKTLKTIATDVLTDVGLRVGSAVVEKLEKTYSWATKGVQKFFSGTATSSSGRKRRSNSASLPTAVDVTVTIMLTTQGRVNATITETNASSSNNRSSATSGSDKVIEDAYNDVLQAIRNGSSILRNIPVPAADDSSSFTVTPSSISECVDVACDTTNPNVTNIVYPHSGATSVSLPQLMLFLSFVVLLTVFF